MRAAHFVEHGHGFAQRGEARNEIGHDVARTDGADEEAEGLAAGFGQGGRGFATLIEDEAIALRHVKDFFEPDAGARAFVAERAENFVVEGRAEFQLPVFIAPGEIDEHAAWWRPQRGHGVGAGAAVENYAAFEGAQGFLKRKETCAVSRAELL